MKNPIFRSVEHQPGMYAVEFVNDEGKALFLIPILERPDTEKGKHDVEDSSTAALRAYHLAKAYIRFWEGYR